jgi:hypothetical protein
MMDENRFVLLPVSGVSVSTASIVQDVKRVASFLNGIVTMAAYAQHGKYNVSTVERRFGSWSEAIKECGFKAGNIVDYSDDALFENLLVLWEYYGRQPRRVELAQPPSKISQSPYNRRFSGWTAALNAFVSYANASDLSIETSQIDRRRSSRDPSWRQRFRILQRDNFKCTACGASPAITPGVQLHVDHILAWSKGGETVDPNLQTLCQACNIGKSNVL